MLDIDRDERDCEAALEVLIGFVSDIYEYLNLDLPEDFDTEVELVNVIDAITELTNGDDE